MSLWSKSVLSSFLQYSRICFKMRCNYSVFLGSQLDPIRIVGSSWNVKYKVSDTKEWHHITAFGPAPSLWHCRCDREPWWFPSPWFELLYIRILYLFKHPWCIAMLNMTISLSSVKNLPLPLPHDSRIYTHAANSSMNSSQTAVQTAALNKTTSALICHHPGTSLL